MALLPLWRLISLTRGQRQGTRLFGMIVHRAPVSWAGALRKRSREPWVPFCQPSSDFMSLGIRVVVECVNTESESSF
jgi:hypothetical protein